jgi:two-component system OmpR family response regulator
LAVRILVAEDDEALGRTLKRGLEEEGHQVTLVTDGRRVNAALPQNDACVLDVMLPGLDGFTIVERARAAGVRTPILILTAKDAIPDRVAGLRRGADDYLTKPFAFAELTARLDALTRRSVPPLAVLSSGDLSLDRAAHRATLAGRELSLSEKQFALLELFLRHAGRVVTRQMVLREVFGYSFDPGTNLVDVHVAHLRQKLDRAGRITTVRGVGYRLEDV